MLGYYSHAATECSPSRHIVAWIVGAQDEEPATRRSSEDDGVPVTNCGTLFSNEMASFVGALFLEWDRNQSCSLAHVCELFHLY